MSEEQSVKIAILESDVKWIKESMREIITQNKEAYQEMQKMSAVLQRGRGAFGASVLFAGIIGGFIHKIIAALLNTGGN